MESNNKQQINANYFSCLRSKELKRGSIRREVDSRSRIYIGYYKQVHFTLNNKSKFCITDINLNQQAIVNHSIKNISNTGQLENKMAKQFFNHFYKLIAVMHISLLLYISTLIAVTIITTPE